MDVSDDGHHRPWSPREMAPPQRRSRGTHLRRRFPSSARRSAAAACWLAAPIVRWRPAQECKIVSTCGRHFLVTDHRPPIPWETHRHVTRHWLCHFIMIFTSTLNIIVTCHFLNNYIGFWCRTNQVASLGHVAVVCFCFLNFRRGWGTAASRVKRNQREQQEQLVLFRVHVSVDDKSGRSGANAGRRRCGRRWCRSSTPYDAHDAVHKPLLFY